jgi:hypothetical protein
MHYLILVGAIVVLFLALPWLAIAFNRYCDAVNRLVVRRRTRRAKAAARATARPDVVDQYTDPDIIGTTEGP